MIEQEVGTGSPFDLDHVVVVGGSLAGLRACETLRAEGFRGLITLVGDELHMYDRPPLSKRLLSGQWEPERIMLRKPGVIDELDLDLRLGRRAESLDLAARSVVLDGGQTLAFDGLIIATGSRPRRLPGQPEFDGVFVLRTLDDALALRTRLDPGARVVIIGAGFIGLEVAATARQRGCEVAVIEALDAPLVRGLGPTMGAAVASIHARHGVEIRCATRVESIDGAAGRVSGVTVQGGEVLAADLVVVGIGVAPATDWLRDSGLELRDGVVCDATLCAGVAGIYAAGDIVRWPHALYGEEIRIEHWTNAAEQGAAAAQNLLVASAGRSAAPYAEVPFFWSDQFDRRIQFLGRSGTEHADTQVELAAGDVDSGAFVALFGREDRLWGVLGVNMPRAVMPFRARLAARIGWQEALDVVRAPAP